MGAWVAICQLWLLCQHTPRSIERPSRWPGHLRASNSPKAIRQVLVQTQGSPNSRIYMCVTSMGEGWTTSSILSDVLLSTTAVRSLPALESEPRMSSGLLACDDPADIAPHRTSTIRQRPSRPLNAARIGQGGYASVTRACLDVTVWNASPGLSLVSSQGTLCSTSW